MSIERNKAAFEGIQNKFKSGNGVPVERITVTRQEMTGAFRYWLYKLTDGGLCRCSDDEFEEWVNDLATHWTSDLDAAWQAWQEQQETIDVLRARIKDLEGEL